MSVLLRDFMIFEDAPLNFPAPVDTSETTLDAGCFKLKLQWIILFALFYKPNLEIVPSTCKMNNSFCFTP